MSELTVITGPMFSGKTRKLLNIYNHILATGRKRDVVLIKPDTDTRENVTHDGETYNPVVVGSGDNKAFKEIMDKNGFIFIDEAQFFGREIYEIIRASVQSDEGKVIYVAGLDLDSDGVPYGIMPDLLALADEVLKLNANCDACGKDGVARSTYCKVDKTQRDLIGGTDLFMALCWECRHELRGGGGAKFIKELEERVGSKAVNIVPTMDKGCMKVEFEDGSSLNVGWDLSGEGSDLK